MTDRHKRESTILFFVAVACAAAACWLAVATRRESNRNVEAINELSARVAAMEYASKEKGR